MLINYFKTTYRNWERNKAFAIFNILGLAVGLSSVILIGVYVQHELSYDTLFKDSDRIYRVALERVYPQRKRFFASSSAVLAPTLQENTTAVESATRFQRLFFQDEVVVQIGDKSFEESQFRFADSAFFDVFSHQFLYGNPKTALDDPNKIVLTKATAEKFFGTANALNKTLVAFDTITFSVAGVIENIPNNSHMHFDLLGSIFIQEGIQLAIEDNNWINPWLYTYVKLKEGENQEKFEKGLEPIIEKVGKGNITQRLGENYKAEGHRFLYFLQPIEDIHLTSNLDVEVEANSDATYVYLLSIIAGIILIISTINFVNLSTARSSERAKEVGVRKVLGSHRAGLIRQFIAEAIITIIFSAFLAFGFLMLSLPFFNELLNTHLSLQILTSPVAIISVVIFVLLVGLLAGIYPAMVISSLKAAKVLKGSYKTSSKGIWLRNALIVLQFFISVVMISGAVAVHQQMNFLKNKDLGFNQENILVIENIAALDENIQPFKDELNTMSQVVSNGGAFAMPSDFIGSGVFKIVDNPELSQTRANTITIDDYFFNTMQFELLEGRAFEETYNDSASAILNEAAVKAFGLENPIGSQITNTGIGRNDVELPTYTVVGVMKDYNFTSLHSAITPLVLYNGSGDFQAPVQAVRFKSNRIGETVNMIEATWAKYTDAPFSYSFLDENLQNQYEADFATGKIFDLFTYIAILISCVGLFGLATYVVQQRTKEMSIRKVLGANSMNIIISFSQSFLKLIAIAYLLGIPVSYYLINLWLENFAFHIDISIVTFVIAGVLTFLFVLLTVSYQTLKIAFVNPVDSIRRE